MALIKLMLCFMPHPNHFYFIAKTRLIKIYTIHDRLVTYTAACRNRDLDGVASALTHVLEVEGFVRGLVVTAFYRQRVGVDGHRHRRRPVGVHLPILMVETLQLQLQIRPTGPGMNE